MRPLRILTWHVHGSYLYYLSHAHQQFYLPFRPDGRAGYGGRGSTFPFSDNLHEVPVEALKSMDFDCILFQSRQHYLEDQFEILSPTQRRLPRIYLEHDPPREHPTDTRHPVDDPDVLLIHVTAFNDLMWDSGRTPTRVIEHGVVIPEGVRHVGDRPRGLVVINNLRCRGRRLGLDLFERVRREVPLDLVGMDSESLDGLGEISPPELPAFAASYRFFFNPIRYTSLGLAVCEAMMVGMPIIGLATTEMVTVVENGVSGYLGTDVGKLIERMRELIGDADEARSLGRWARRHAEQRFSINRFASDWDEVFALVTGRLVSSDTLLVSRRTAS
jgi:glycosyltransferase involved in cell wall biosynthesis